MTDDQNQPRLALPVKIFIVVWLVLILLGALNHNIFPKLGGRIDAPQLPHLRYGYVMFNRSPPVVPVIHYQPWPSREWIHISDLVNTPAPLYKRSRVLIDILFTNFDYMLALCARGPGTQDAIFRVERHAPAHPERKQVDRYVCHEHRLYPEE